MFKLKWSWPKIKVAKQKTPSLIMQVITIMYERALAKKAMRILTKQIWGTEFLSYVLRKCMVTEGTNLELVIVNQNGARIILRSAELQPQYTQPDIFDRLDDKLAVQQFMRSNSLV